VCADAVLFAVVNPDLLTYPPAEMSG